MAQNVYRWAPNAKSPLMASLNFVGVLKNKAMQHLETTVLIEAPITTVWSILMDFEQYPSWNPFIQKIEGQAIVGQAIKAVIHPPNQNPMTFKPTVLVNETEKEFRWRGKLFVRGIFDGEHYFILEKVGSTTTKLIHGEKFSGILVGLIMRSIREDTLKGFNRMNEALKNRAENR